jgi:hypothetical protein
VERALIKWIVIGLLVAGTFGVFWTAPWKDDVERVTNDVQQKLGTARATLGVLDSSTRGDCKKVGQTAPGNVRQAVDTIVAEAKRNPNAKVPGASGESPSTVGEVAKRQANQIGDCIKRFPNTGAGWVDLKNKLEQAGKGG